MVFVDDLTQVQKMKKFLSFLLIFLCYLLIFLCYSQAFAELEAHFLDVGHGDCTIITCDGETLSVSSAQTAEAGQEQYIGNSNSNVYHRSTCESAIIMKDHNKVYFESAEQAEKMGYRPCKRCDPGNK